MSLAVIHSFVFTNVDHVLNLWSICWWARIRSGWTVVYWQLRSRPLLWAVWIERVALLSDDPDSEGWTVDQWSVEDNSSRLLVRFLESCWKCLCICKKHANQGSSHVLLKIFSTSGNFLKTSHSFPETNQTHPCLKNCGCIITSFVKSGIQSGSSHFP